VGQKSVVGKTLKLAGIDVRFSEAAGWEQGYRNESSLERLWHWGRVFGCDGFRLASISWWGSGLSLLVNVAVMLTDRLAIVAARQSIA